MTVMINLHESVGLGRDPTHNPWICNQTFICCQTCYRLCYTARLSHTSMLINSYMLGRVILHAFFVVQKYLSRIPSECQTVWIQIRPDKMLGLIWVQTACESHHFFHTEMHDGLSRLGLRKKKSWKKYFCSKYFYPDNFHKMHHMMTCLALAHTEDFFTFPSHEQ